MNIQCPTCGSKAVEGMICRDGGSSVCSNESCGKNFHYCKKLMQVTHQIPMDCCFHIRGEYICPSCGSPPVPGLICKDGGSSVCSSLECGRPFHYCKNTQQLTHGVPLDCCGRLW